MLSKKLYQIIVRAYESKSEWKCLRMSLFFVTIAILCKENKEDEFMFLMYELGIDKSKFEIINEICLC